MQLLRTPSSAGDRVLDALQACCGALRALELAAVLAALEANGRDPQQIVRATRSLRHAISELYAIEHRAGSVLPKDFVLPREDGSP